MEVTPPPELADHEEHITKLENAMVNLSCELKALRAHMDCRFKEIETKIETESRSLRIELRAEFDAKLHEAVDKMHARMDAHHHLQIALQVAIFLALIALFAQR